MMGQGRERNLCDNLNHRRAQAPVRHCPMCGGIVNQRVRAPLCSETQHALSRRQGSAFCADCGTRLVADR